MAQYPERIPRNHYGEEGSSTVFAHAQEWLVAVKENKPEICYSRLTSLPPHGDHAAGLRVIARGRDEGTPYVLQQFWVITPSPIATSTAFSSHAASSFSGITCRSTFERIMVE
jgi:hypothetical protein